MKIGFTELLVVFVVALLVILLIVMIHMWPPQILWPTKMFGFPGSLPFPAVKSIEILLNKGFALRNMIDRRFDRIAKKAFPAAALSMV